MCIITRWVRTRFLVRAFFIYTLTFCGSCGVKGDPVPPGRVYPLPPSKIGLEVNPQGVRVGCQVPSRNSDGSALRDLVVLELWRAGPRSDDCPKCPPMFRKLHDIPYEYPLDAQMAGGSVEYLDELSVPGEYSYRLIAVTQRGVRGNPSPSVKIYWDLPPQGVLGVKVEPGDGQVEIQWEAVVQLADGKSAEGVAYQVFRARKGAGFGDGPINSSPLPETSFLDKDVANNMSYVYRVRALRPVGDQWIHGPFSKTVEATPQDLIPPQPPTGLVAFATTEGIRLVWEGGEKAEISGYHVYRAQEASGPWELLTEQPLSTILFEDRDVETGRYYWYGVTALDNASPPNESEMSETVKARLR